MGLNVDHLFGRKLCDYGTRDFMNSVKGPIKINRIVSVVIKLQPYRQSH